MSNTLFLSSYCTPRERILLKWGAGLLLAILLHVGLLLWLSWREDIVPVTASLPPVTLMLLPSTQPASAATETTEDRTETMTPTRKESVAEQQEASSAPSLSTASHPVLIARKKSTQTPAAHTATEHKKRARRTPDNVPNAATQPAPAASASAYNPPQGTPQPSQVQPGQSPVHAQIVEQTSWATLLLQRLERYKRYPTQALRQQARGVVLLGLTLNRAGDVLAVHIVQSSGTPSLDKETLALPARAAPLPALTDDIAPGEHQVSVTLPVRFDFR